MKIFDLLCANDHRFEGWFASGADFDRQRDSGIIACPMCGTMNAAGATACYACGEELYPASEPGSAGQLARFDVGDQFSKGLDLFKADMGTCIAATIVYLLVPGAINFVMPTGRVDSPWT